MGRHLDEDDGADFKRGRHRLHTRLFLILLLCGLVGGAIVFAIALSNGMVHFDR